MNPKHPFPLGHSIAGPQQLSQLAIHFLLKHLNGSSFIEEMRRKWSKGNSLTFRSCNCLEVSSVSNMSAPMWWNRDNLWKANGCHGSHEFLDSTRPRLTYLDIKLLQYHPIGSVYFYLTTSSRNSREDPKEEQAASIMKQLLVCPYTLIKKNMGIHTEVPLKTVTLTTKKILQ